MKSICSDFTPKYCDIHEQHLFYIRLLLCEDRCFWQLPLSPVITNVKTYLTSWPWPKASDITHVLLPNHSRRMSEAWGCCSHCWKHHGVIFPTSLCHELENKYPQTSGHLGPLGIGSPGTHGHWVTWEPWDPFVWEEKLFSGLIGEYGWSCWCLCWGWGVKENDMML